MRFFFLFFAWTYCCPAFAQAPEKALEQFSKSFPQEKVVLRFSKPEYLAGEVVYFKAYVLNGYEPSDISTNLYTELYDKNKNLLDKQIIPLLKGSGDGSFSLPANLAEDVYYIRAYTQWMRNFAEAFQCIKPVHIYNPYSSQILRPKPVQWTAHAFAEGGNLVDGAVANLAVRLYTTGTLPQSWSGKLVEKETNTVISDVMVFNNEIGQVRFVPEGGKTYKLVLKDNTGTVQESNLPPVALSGIVLQTTATADKLRYAILFKGLPAAGKGYKLIAAFNSEPVYVASITKSTGEVSGTFDVKNLPAGILQLSLFDEKGQPAAERLCFVHQEALQVSEPAVKIETLSFAPKAHNRWQFTTDSLNWQSYAVEVTDAALPQENNFLSDIYLTSDFSSPVYNASWYFDSVTDAKIAALDALLTTEKWNRYQWNEILQNHFPSIRFKPDLYLSYAGLVTKGKKPQPLREMNLLLQAADSSISFLQVKTDSTGSFDLHNLFFLDTVKIFYQPGKRKFMENEVEISMQSLNRFSPLTGNLPGDGWTTGTRSKTDTLPLAIQRAAAEKSTEMLLTQKEKMMEEVVVKTKARNATEELDKQLSSGLFSGGDPKLFDFVNNDQSSAAGSTNILEWLQGRLAGYSVTYNDGVAIPQIRFQPAQVFIDEMHVDYDQVANVAVSDIALIKIFSGSFIGSRGGGSAIAIYTRKGGMQQKNSTPAMPTQTIAGYRKLLPAPAPDYAQGADPDIKDERIVLFRQTLLKPQAGTEKAFISFYNNDKARQFCLQITGFTREGKIVYLTKYIQ